MTGLRRILAATDLSAPAHHALNRAFHIAAESGAQLTLMHALSNGGMDALRGLLGAEASKVEQYIIDEACDVLRGTAAELGQSCGVSAAVRISTGDPLREILDQADALDVDLLVLGACGEGFLRHLLLGSTVERLLRKTIRPVLVVRRLPHEAYRRVLVPVDFAPCSVPALQAARVLSPEAEIVVLHAFSLPFEGKLRYAGVSDESVRDYRLAERNAAYSQTQALVADAGIGDRVRIVVRHGDPFTLIREVGQQESCDLIALGKHGRNMLEEMLLGSVTKHVVAEADCDVLVVGSASR